MTTPKLGRVVHFDLIVDNTAEAGTYYTGASDWIIETGDETYKPANPQEGPSGGIWFKTQFQNRLIAYFLVSSVADFVAEPPTGFEIKESGNHPSSSAQGTVKYAIAESSKSLLIGVMEFVEPSEPNT